MSPDEFGSDDEEELNDSDVDESESPCKCQKLMDAANGHGRTRSHVAELLDMKAVQPWAIAYIAVQVSGALHYASNLLTHLQQSYASCYLACQAGEILMLRGKYPSGKGRGQGSATSKGGAHEETQRP